MASSSTLSKSDGRTLILLFDGTTNQFSATNTNIIKLTALLDKTRQDQTIYYQSGVGTYPPPGLFSQLAKWTAQLIDLATAAFIDVHILGGYTYLCNNWRQGDRICIFGFSRGAYTARCVAGMIEKVGLLMPENEENFSKAYAMYADKTLIGRELARGFKATFGRNVRVDFVGCFDTVSSVGVLFTKTLPFTYSSTSINYFRQVLALDERRTRFQPAIFARPESQSERNPHVPVPASAFDKTPIDVIQERARQHHDQSKKWSTTNVKEVWVSGCHTDCGGGSSLDTAPSSLANVGLGWMVREMLLLHKELKIRFDADALVASGIDVNLSEQNADDWWRGVDATSPMHDNLASWLSPWWLLEILPLGRTWQTSPGHWKTSYWPNLGRHRHLPAPDAKIYTSVEYRMQKRSRTYHPALPQDYVFWPPARAVETKDSLDNN
ncbi:uncharacterized protein L969DRAFT_84114 [Mixia osmundae IAM 14324]|uniref:T6SS Phospholipase effector Tle1-like catalytic domain-containing protein n=1 Tax=Mixia osmundae (strain CBS 9802 / IAM 14324 / JCM 22182 / KY 12970) TaxID=764103 RepID=G7E0A5_MIXOS|nr:uncharacterized protein L969DRAFT_84114 [Mixia osmundae IAM 14324]KEI42256.1 hypothetical protein L969DRAFT_84114 [Mixia osmundae IAM 14324]GAA96265.1 hypothetical protein E5Q_02930 [Mixia osmundae IAM 14324]